MFNIFRILQTHGKEGEEARYFYRGYYNGEQIIEALNRGEIFVKAKDIDQSRVNPAGIDLTADKFLDLSPIKEPDGRQLLDPSNWPKEALVPPDGKGFVKLESGKRYLAGLREVLQLGRISLELEAKSSYTRGGCGIRNQYYGYDPAEKRKEPRQGFVALDIHNPHGFTIQEGAPLVQATVYSNEFVSIPKYEPKSELSEPLVVGEIKEFIEGAQYGIEKSDRNVNVTHILEPNEGGIIILKKGAPYLITFTEQIITLGADKFSTVWPTSLVTSSGDRFLVYGAYGDPGFTGTYSALVIPTSTDTEVIIGEPLSERLTLEVRTIPALKPSMLYAERSGTFQSIGIDEEESDQKEILFPESQSQTLARFSRTLIKKIKLRDLEKLKMEITASLGNLAQTLRRSEIDDFYREAILLMAKAFTVLDSLGLEGYREVIKKVEANRQRLYFSQGSYDLPLMKKAPVEEVVPSELSVSARLFTCKQLQEEIWKNKVRKDFNVGDLGLELVHLLEELGELVSAGEDKETLGDACVDLIIYTFGMFEMGGREAEESLKSL